MKSGWSLHSPTSRNLLLPIIVWILLSGTTLVQATKVDITGPSGSVAFGTSVTVLSNGNFVVTDPHASHEGMANAGAVHLYHRDGSLVSTLTGSSADDYVGGRVYEVGESNFVVTSPSWSNGAANDAGAVTWVDGEEGLAGVVSSDNSLVGTASNDRIGWEGVVTVGDGKYVVISPLWSNGAATQVGAITWGDGNAGLTGFVSSENSLVGASAYDHVGATYGSSYFGGGVVPLLNGNYVVISPDWNNGAIADAGAVTWVNGATGLTGPVSSDNSLVGTTPNDRIGIPSVTALANGNYVVASMWWQNPEPGGDGAITWGSGQGGLTGPVSIGNSLVGSTNYCCNDARWVTALTNGNYVVSSPGWSGLVDSGGAVTWADGDTGLVGTISAENSLVGTTAFDLVGYGASPGAWGAGGITALANGNYVVASSGWQGDREGVGGAATWADGERGVTGPVSIDNSLVGTGFSDVIVTALTNGNYVVAMPNWNWKDGSASGPLGAVTWADGTMGLSGRVSVENSLVNTRGIYGGQGAAGVTALSDGNYVVASPRWSAVGAEAPARDLGAVTWGNGSTGIVGQVAASNSIVGTSPGERVGSGGAIALTNGNYVFSSPRWPGLPKPYGGAVTWAYGGHSTIGNIDPENSLVGAYVGDGLLSGGLLALEDGNYVMASLRRQDERGLVILGNGNFPQVGTVQEFNSVTGVVPYDGPNMVLDYDVERSTLVVGRPGENMVTLLSMEWIFAGSFE